MTAPDLLARTRPMGECLVWTGAVQSSGYGSVWTGQRSELAHRVSYRQHVGPIPEGHQVDHVRARGCRSRLCINPAHLEPVTCVENVHRTGHGQQTHRKRGHPLTGSNLLLKRRGARPTVRNCRTCRDERAAS